MRALSDIASTVLRVNDDDLALLRFEKLRWNHQGAKAEEVRRRFGLSLTQYLQRVHALCDRPEALAAEPVLVNRINRRRRGVLTPSPLRRRSTHTLLEAEPVAH